MDQSWLPPDTLLKYGNFYVEACGDTFFQQRLIGKQQERTRAFKADLQLVNQQCDTTLLQDVQKKHQGKVIYIDYWASWCFPCRREMPAAKKLREEYKGKEVVFLYLALNDSPNEWKEAIEKEKIDYLGENYLIINACFAKMVEELKIQTIPRFMIYDRSGKLVEPNAPRPGTPEIRQLLNKYLK